MFKNYNLYVKLTTNMYNFIGFLNFHNTLMAIIVLCNIIYLHTFTKCVRYLNTYITYIAMHS